MRFLTVLAVYSLFTFAIFASPDFTAQVKASSRIKSVEVELSLKGLPDNLTLESLRPEHFKESKLIVRGEDHKNRVLEAEILNIASSRGFQGGNYELRMLGFSVVFRFPKMSETYRLYFRAEEHLGSDRYEYHVAKAILRVKGRNLELSNPKIHRWMDSLEIQGCRAALKKVQKARS